MRIFAVVPSGRGRQVQ